MNCRPDRRFHTAETEHQLRSQFTELCHSGRIGPGIVLSQVPSWGNASSFSSSSSSSSALLPLQCDFPVRTRSPEVQAASWRCSACLTVNGLESFHCMGTRVPPLPLAVASRPRICGHARCPRCIIRNASCKDIKTAGGQNLMLRRETELAGWECSACGADNRFVSSDLPRLQKMREEDNDYVRERPMRCSTSHCLHSFDERDFFINFFGERVVGPFGKDNLPPYHVIG